MLDGAKSDTARINSHIHIAHALSKTNYRIALEHATRAVRLSEKSGVYSSKIESLKVAGNICYYKGLNDLAVQFFNKQYELAKAAEDDIEAGTAYFNLGGVYIALLDYKKAQEIFKEAYRIMEVGYKTKKLPIPASTQIAFMMNMAIIHWNEGDIHKADSMLALCEPLIEDRPEMEHKLISIYHITALLEIKSQDPQAALSSLERSRSLALKYNDLPGIAATYITAGEAHDLLGDLDAAKRSYETGLRYADQYKGISDQMMNAEGLYKLYRKTGPSDSVVKYFDLFTKLKEQSKSQQAKEDLMRADLMRDYNRMVMEWERQQESSKQKNIYLSLILVLASIITLVTYIKYRNRNRKMRFEKVRRDLEERKARFEQLRLQAELDQRVSELEEIKSALRNQQILEGLVSGLDPDKKGASDADVTLKSTPGSISERKAKAWEEFEYRFQQLHSGFYDRLNQRFHGLTINERRLCAFVKLDMTTKEISDITGQSVRAIHMARIRLRNKLGLTHTDKDLFEFLSAL